ncbi:TRAP transporter large permease [Pseudogemmobacter faecipullorum]|uniref:TRAP transporter large permease protein n=1 Tax=Pseudogemmobacter faecipullorum TaxID=2755041 RepID=A0ABS8CPH3_9RHOB|nr:TRAP transporter large permease [Pseudogemmobacter faecipullorum]MCB5411286.1 TRAP transporter large permease [Pseudogemmobacter faecipullorum]
MLMLLTLALVLFALMFLAVPIAISLGIASLVIVLLWGTPGFVLAQKMLNGIDSFPLLAVPFFILAAAIMNAGGITTRIVDLLGSAMGRLRGSSGQVNIGTNLFLAGISGSSVADASATGALLIPEMKKEGYSGAFAAALTATAALLGPILPPSIPLVIYGVIAEVSIVKLFIGGYIPALMIVAALVFVVNHHARKHNLPRRGRQGGAVIWKKFRVSIWAMSMPILLIIGARGGYFTITEIGAVLVVYAIFVGWVIHREFRWGKLPGILTEAGMQTANIMLVVATSSFVAYLMVVHGVPKDLSRWIQEAQLSPVVFLLLINVILLIAGAFLDSTPATIIIVPIVLPSAIALGIDPVHFGLVVVINLMIGLIHPPMGLNLLITQSIAKEPMGAILKEGLPLLGIMLIILMLVTFVPATVLWLPQVMGL